MNTTTASELSTRQQARPRVTLVTEAYNLAEGQSEHSFVRALQSVDAICRRHDGVEVMVLDPTAEHVAQPILEKHFPVMRCLHVPGQTYDGQKNLAALASRGEFLVFLDGDCVPTSAQWLEQLLNPFLRSDIHAVTGLTLYEGADVTSKAMTILDFGFLFTPAANGTLGCYVSNNVAFRQAAYLKVMAPDEGVLRSYCYKHAQLLSRAGMPVHAQHSALVRHELPDVEKERNRRGYDYVAALWVDPVLRETSALACNRSFACGLVQQNAALALARLAAAPPALGITESDRPAIWTEIQRLMALDLKGVLEALEIGEVHGFNAQARTAHRELFGAFPGTSDRLRRLDPSSGRVGA